MRGGQSTIRQLLNQSDRARLQLPALTERYGNHLNDVLGRGEIRQLMPIGNYCRDTKFLNGNYLITPGLVAVFDRISLPIDGFYYGRFDRRCRSVEDLYRGKYIRILELNGAGVEPARYRVVGRIIMVSRRCIINLIAECIRPLRRAVGDA